MIYTYNNISKAPCCHDYHQDVNATLERLRSEDTTIEEQNSDLSCRESGSERKSLNP